MATHEEILEHYTARAEKIYLLANKQLTENIAEQHFAYASPESFASYSHALIWCSRTLGIPNEQMPPEAVIAYLIRLMLETDYLVNTGMETLLANYDKDVSVLFASVDMVKSALEIKDIPLAGIFKRYEYFCILGLEALIRGTEHKEKAYILNGENTDIELIPRASFCKTIDSMSEYMLAQRACQEVVLDFFGFDPKRYAEFHKLIEKGRSSKGGKATAQKRQQASESMQKEWQALANEIWAERGKENLTKSHIARIIQTRMTRLPEEKYTVKYIAEKITKPNP